MSALTRCSTPPPCLRNQENLHRTPPKPHQPNPAAPLSTSKKRGLALAALALTNSPSKPAGPVSNTLTDREIREALPPMEARVVILDTTANQDQLQRIKKCARAAAFVPPSEEGDTGANGALFLRDPATRANEFVTKFDYREQGTPFGRIVKPDVPFSKSGINPREGAFAEHLSACVLQEWLKDLGISSEEVFLPPSSFCELAHLNLYQQIPTQIQIKLPDNPIPYSVGSRASVQEFFHQSCTSFKRAKKTWEAGWQHTLPTRSVQAIALFDLLLLNTDRNAENLLLHKTETGTIQLIPIDQALVLPRPGQFESFISPVVTCLQDLDQLKTPLDPALKEFVLNTLSADSLSYQLERMKRKGIQEAISFDPQRVLMHEIACHLVKEGVKADLSVYQILQLFIKPPGSFRSIAAPAVIHTKMDGFPPLSIERLCHDLIQEYKEKCVEGSPPISVDTLYQLFLMDR